MALNDILEQIASEAKVKSDELSSQFDELKKQMEAEQTASLNQMEKDSEKKTAEDSKKSKEKAEMEAEMEAKNGLLTAKRQVIDETLIKSITELAASDQYVNILADMLRSTDLDSSAEVIPARGKEDQTRKAIEASGKNYRVASESANFSGGFILKADKVEIDNSFETLIQNELRPNLEIELNKVLF